MFPKQTTRKQIKALSFLANGPSSFDTIKIYQRSEQMFAWFFLQYHVPGNSGNSKQNLITSQKSNTKKEIHPETHTHKSQTKNITLSLIIPPFTCRFLNFRSCHPPSCHPSAFSEIFAHQALDRLASGKKPNLQPTYPDPMTGRFCSCLPLKKNTNKQQLRCPWKSNHHFWVRLVSEAPLF